MKKKSIKILVVIFLLIGLFLSIRFISFGTMDFSFEHPKVKVKIPVFSNIVEDWGNDKNEFSLTFQSISSKGVLEKELNDIIKNYSEMECHGSIYYYDEKNNITIKEYGIDEGFIINKYTINYYNGKYSSDECNK